MSKSKRRAQKGTVAQPTGAPETVAPETVAPETEGKTDSAKTDSAKTDSAEAEGREGPPPSRPRAYLAMTLAWLVPGGGHFLLGRWRRAIFFAVWILLALAFGCYLDGRLPWTWGGTPLQVLATAGALGSGVPFLALRFVLGYEGDLRAPGYEYGSAFILTAGLMNLLLILDSWDIATGRKE